MVDWSDLPTRSPMGVAPSSPGSSHRFPRPPFRPPDPATAFSGKNECACSSKIAQDRSKTHPRRVQDRACHTNLGGMTLQCRGHPPTQPREPMVLLALRNIDPAHDKTCPHPIRYMLEAPGHDIAKPRTPRPVYSLLHVV